MASRKHWNYGTKDDDEFDRVNTVIGETFAHSAEMNRVRPAARRTSVCFLLVTP
jgi:hypothetical protein